MAEKQYLDNNGLSVYHEKIKKFVDDNYRPRYLGKASYTGVYSRANNNENRRVYFIKWKPIDTTKPWNISYDLVANIPNQANSVYFGHIEVNGCKDVLISYAVTNNHYNTSYRAIYYHSIIYHTTAGLTNGKWGYCGIDLNGAYEQSNVNYKRDMTVFVTECHNVEWSLETDFDSMGTYGTLYESTYHKISNIEGQNNGLRETGDNDDYYNLYYGYAQPIARANQNASGATSNYGAELLLSQDNGQTWFSICTNSCRVYSSAANKNLPTVLGFQPEYITYTSDSATKAAGDKWNTYNWYKRCNLDFRYSSNFYNATWGSTLVKSKPVYLICDYNKTDKLFYLNTDKTLSNLVKGTSESTAENCWTTQILPTQKDNKYYVYLGMASDTYAIVLDDNHQIYTYDGAFVQRDPRIACDTVKNLSVSGTTITVTKGDNTTSSITTQDTKYSAGDGLKLNGTEFYIPQIIGSKRVIDTHGEGGAVVLPFVQSEISYLKERGGSYQVTDLSGNLLNKNLDALFDANAGYTYMDDNWAGWILTIDLHKVFAWGTHLGIHFGSGSWSPRNLKVEFMNTANSEGYIVAYDNQSFTGNLIYVPLDNAGKGLNKIKITMSNNNKFRIAGIWLSNYAGLGIAETMLPRNGGTVYGGFVPAKSGAYTLGSSSKYFSSAYITTTYGDLNGTATNATILKNWFSSRPASADVASFGDGGLRKFVATSSMTTGKPMCDGHIIHSSWDNSGKYGAELFLPCGDEDAAGMQYRGENAGVWRAWRTVLDTNNYKSYTVTKTGEGASGTWGINISGNAAKDSDGNAINTTYLKLSGGTMTGSIKGLPVDGGIYWNPYVESTTDGTDAASITIVKKGVTNGTTMCIRQNGDEADTIQFCTNSSANLYHNNSKIYTQANKSTLVSDIESTVKVRDTNITWGGPGVSGDVTPVGNALSSWHSANRLAFADPAGFTVETCNNFTSATPTWTVSNITDQSKTQVLTTEGNIGITADSTDKAMRFTLAAKVLGIYCRPRKLLINVSTGNSNCTVKLEYALGTGAGGAIDATTASTWYTVGTYKVSGWSGWNDIPITLSTFGGGNTQTTNIWFFRLTFSCGEINETASYRFFQVLGLQLFSSTYWQTPSTLAKTNHLYSIDHQKKAEFPADVKAPTFTGALKGNADTATLATNATNDADGNEIKNTYLKLVSGTNSAPIVKINSIQNETYCHRVDLGRPGFDHFDFHEYGGIFNFYKNQGTTASTATLLGKITVNGWEGPVKGNVTGNATSADKLNTNAGSSSTPVYFSNGVPVACPADTALSASSTNAIANSAVYNKFSTVESQIANIKQFLSDAGFVVTETSSAAAPTAVAEGNDIYDRIETLESSVLEIKQTLSQILTKLNSAE